MLRLRSKYIIRQALINSGVIRHKSRTTTFIKAKLNKLDGQINIDNYRDVEKADEEYLIWIYLRI